MRAEFSTKTKRAAFTRAAGRCEACHLPLSGRPDYDHEKTCAEGGDNSLANCVVLCKPCHKLKTKADVARLRKADRQRNAAAGAKAAKRPLKSGPSNLRGPARRHSTRPPLAPRQMFK